MTAMPAPLQKYLISQYAGHSRIGQALVVRGVCKNHIEVLPAACQEPESPAPPSFPGSPPFPRKAAFHVGPESLAARTAVLNEKGFGGPPAQSLEANSPGARINVQPEVPSWGPRILNRASRTKSDVGTDRPLSGKGKPSFLWLSPPITLTIYFRYF